jgi:hypothetical protein
MSTVKVFRFRTWDSHTDQIKESRRWGTLEGIEGLGVGAQPIGEGIEVEARFVGHEIEGLTEIGFNPRMPPKPGVFR